MFCSADAKATNAQQSNNPIRRSDANTKDMDATASSSDAAFGTLVTGIACKEARPTYRERRCHHKERLRNHHTEQTFHSQQAQKCHHKGQCAGQRCHHKEPWFLLGGNDVARGSNNATTRNDTRSRRAHGLPWRDTGGSLDGCNQQPKRRLHPLVESGSLVTYYIHINHEWQRCWALRVLAPMTKHLF